MQSRQSKKHLEDLPFLSERRLKGSFEKGATALVTVIITLAVERLKMKHSLFVYRSSGKQGAAAEIATQVSKVFAW